MASDAIATPISPQANPRGWRQIAIYFAGRRQSGGAGFDLDDTAMAVTDKMVRMPQWVFTLILTVVLGAGVGVVWWAASLAGDVERLKVDMAERKQKDEVHELQLGVNMDERIERRVRRVLDDGGWVRVRNSGSTRPNNEE